MTNVSALRISAEYSGIVVETSGLDSVRLTPPCDTTEPPVLNIAFYPGITIIGAVGCTYRIEYTDDLATPNWTSLGNVFLDQLPFIVFDTTASNLSRRFYRAVHLDLQS